MPQAQNQGLTHDAAGNITSFAPNDSLSYDDANRLIAVNGERSMETMDILTIWPETVLGGAWDR